MASAVPAFAGAVIAEDFLVISLRGDLDIAAITPLREWLLALAERATRTIVLDVADVTFVESSALGMFVGVHKRVRERGHAFVIANSTGRMARTIELTALHRAIPVAFVETPVRPWERPISGTELLAELGL